MTEGKQWRFQWPDGTWIRWNAQTQSWEKEEHGDPVGDGLATDAPPAVDPASVAASETSETSSSPRAPHDVSGASDVPSAPRTVPEREEPSPEVAVAERVERAQEATALEEPPRESGRATGARRPSARDVLPRPDEPDRPGGSLWPTIVAGALIGIGVGLVLAAAIR